LTGEDQCNENNSGCSEFKAFFSWETTTADVRAQLKMVMSILFSANLYIAISCQAQQYEESRRIGNESEEIVSNLNGNS